MPFRNATNPSESDLHAWAYDSHADVPMQDWDLVLSWVVERGLLARCVQYAGDPKCPKAAFFLDVLYQWVLSVAKAEGFEFRRTMYDDWLEVARGITDAHVKQWRHQARLVFQNVEPFDRERWSVIWLAARQDAEQLAAADGGRDNGS